MVGRRGATPEQRPSRGQTETIGVVLILSMTLVGATIALAFGATALDEARLSSQEEGVQHALTQLDSRAAMVALGDSGTQVVPLGASGSGSFRVDPSAGWIKLEHTNYDGTGTGNDTVLYNDSLGALLYEDDDVLIAYQGGGVWRARGDSSTMVSPPEFHYQSATLTLPIIRVSGGATTGGASISAKITNLVSADRIYPSSATYPDGSPYENPIREGNVTVTVKSDYWQAWAEYFRTRTDGEVATDPQNETASVLLLSQGVTGDFSMPSDGNNLVIRGLGEGHPITEFNVTLRPDDTDSADFANLQWTLWAEKGSQQFEIHLREGGKNDDPSTPCTERDVDVTVYYSDKNGDPYHGWHADSAFRTGCDDLDGDGDNETFLKADLVGSSTLAMQSLSSSDLQHYSASGDTALDSITFSEHAGELNAGWEPKEFNTTGGDPDTTIGNLTNHYLSLMGPDVELTVEDKGSNTINEAESSGEFEQSSGGQKFITFLHVTENRVSVEIE